MLPGLVGRILLPVGEKGIRRDGKGQGRHHLRAVHLGYEHVEYHESVGSEPTHANGQGTLELRL